MKRTQMITVGKRIRLAREHAGLTQEKLAETIGVSRTAISRWESGEIDPTIEHLIHLALTLNVSTDYLLGISGKAEVLDMLKEMASTLDRIVSDLQKEIQEEKEEHKANGKK